MSDVNVKIDSAKLRNLAESVSKSENGLKESCYAAKKEIDSLKNIWTGEAADAYQASFQKLMNECNEALNVLGKMVNSLYDSADKYDKSVKAVESEAKNIPKLPTNLFQ